MDGWRERLKQAVYDTMERESISRRQLALQAGLSDTYLYSILVRGNDPTIGNLFKLCERLNLSVTWLLTGLEIDRSTEEMARLFDELPPERQVTFLTLLRDLAQKQAAD